MDVKVAFVIVFLCAFAIISTEAGIPKCCINTKMDIPVKVLMRVYRWTYQKNTGACDTAAIILYVRGMKKSVCANPKLKRKLIQLQQKINQSKQKAS
ncbi:C-C motif chemokine 27b [Centropristis striata]|uniref:C-C motif chemokine 27b n=1 Tax=Centropristis striata TaxID=184440 RepID=UPI0027E1FFCC|nr:C-C motif chemokine 27b [Centropristis striata]